MLVMANTLEGGKAIICDELQEAAQSVKKYTDDLRQMLNIHHKAGTVDMRYVPDDELEAKKRVVFEEFIGSHPSPSWRQFAHALYRLGEHAALQQLFNKHLPRPDKLRCYDAYQRALEADGYHDQIVMQGIMTGFPRAGKSSLMTKLIHKDPDIEAIQPSTGVAENVVRIDISQPVQTPRDHGQATATGTGIASGSQVMSAELTKMKRARMVSVIEQTQWQTASSSNEEFAAILSQIAADLHGVKKNADHSTFSPPLVSPTATESKSFPLPTSPPAEAKPKAHHKRTSSLSNFKVTILKKFRRKKLPVVIPPDEVASNSFISALSEEIVDAGLDTEVLLTLYMSDVGGQPEFQELLAAVVSGPTVFFVVFPLHLSLDGNFKIEYLSEDGESMVAYESSFTVREALLQSLASIASTGIVTSDERKILPKVLFVGTHKDRLSSQTRQADIQRIDRDLQQMVEGTEAIDKNMVVFESESRMIFTVDNTQSSKHPDFDRIRSAIHDIGCESDSVYKVSIPYTWMTLSALLRQRVEQQDIQVYSYDQCFRDAQALGIKDQSEFNNALFFLHTNLGILRHYQDIPELRDRIITDTQHIFNKVTTVIKKTFTFRNCPSKRGTVDEFKRKGIFNKDDLMKLLSTQSQDITPQQLLALLEHLNIIAPFEGRGKSCKYFLPCALQHAPKCEETRISDQSKCYDSLLFTFARGYCPKGIFGAVVVEILKRIEGMKYRWELDQGKIFRNRFSMTIGPYFDQFCFTLLPKYVKIDAYLMKIDQRSKDSLSMICSHVREQVNDSLTEVTRKLNYNDGAKHTPTFLCPNTDGFPHPAQISFLNGNLCSIHCTLHEEVKHEMVDEEHFVWFPSNPVTVLPPLSELVSQLYPVAHSWESLAMQLDIRRSACKRIEYKYQSNPNSPRPQLEAILDIWYESAKSLRQLIKALNVLDENVLAKSLQEIYQISC